MALITASFGTITRICHDNPPFGNNALEAIVIVITIITLFMISFSNFSFLYAALLDLRRRLYVFEFWSNMLEGHLEIDGTDEEQSINFNIDIPMTRISKESNNIHETELQQPLNCQVLDEAHTNKIHTESQIDNIDHDHDNVFCGNYRIAKIDFKDFRSVFHWYRMVLATKDFGKRYYLRLQAYASFFLVSVFFSSLVVIAVMTLNVAMDTESNQSLGSIVGVSLDLTQLDKWVGCFIIFISIYLLSKIAVIVYHGMHIH